MGDQSFWAQRVFKLGVGPRPVSREKLTVDCLGEAIKISINDDAMRAGGLATGKRLLLLK